MTRINCESQYCDKAATRIIEIQQAGKREYYCVRCGLRRWNSFSFDDARDQGVRLAMLRPKHWKRDNS